MVTTIAWIDAAQHAGPAPAAEPGGQTLDIGRLTRPAPGVPMRHDSA